ncbi:MAG: hypothetical protein KDB35_15600 [Acidimicrobiales bacterium]|nr:hypothetical protein [Acidimicrobiales bacterium]MCB1016327.1 hypothetical protein [Acidimicrobiales bacterium]
MAEDSRRRRWPRRLLVLAAVVAVVAVIRDRTIARNEARFGAVPPGAGG